jgi:hypothetical protein
LMIGTYFILTMLQSIMQVVEINNWISLLSLHK